MKQIVPLFLITLTLSSCSTTPKNTKNDLPPSLTHAEVNRIWVPDQIEADKYITGHWVYVIKKPSVWSK